MEAPATFRRYRIQFDGVPVRSQGKASRHIVETSGFCDASAILSLYESHEHIAQPCELQDGGVVRPMQYEGHGPACPCRPALAVVEVNQ